MTTPRLSPATPVAPGRVLLVEDDRDLAGTLRLVLTTRGFEVEHAGSVAEARTLVEHVNPDVVLTDIALGGAENGLDLCAELRSSRPDVCIVVMTGFGSLETSIAALRAGAHDFITKPVEDDLLAIALERAVRHRRLRAEVRRLRRAVGERGANPNFTRDGLVGRSPTMARLSKLLDRVGPSSASVLVTGESGTGKELVARALHRRSKRASGPFVAVNCAAMPDHLLETELFGHVRGAFTDARASRLGLFARASGGTLFLDEIGELPTGLQPKLLRALQEKRVRPVGGDDETPIDVRIVAATNRDLEACIEAGTFREDLYFRINVIHVALPPLRSRGADILLLAQQFVERFAAESESEVKGISHHAAAMLQRYSWPGNVRELANCIERAVALAEYDEVRTDDLPARVRDYQPSHVVIAADDPSELVPLAEVERRYVLRVLDTVGGNKSLAARILGLDRKTLHRKLQRWSAAER